MRRHAPARVIAGGMAVSAVGFAVLSSVGAAPSPLAVLVAGQIIFSIGLTPVVALTTDIVLSAAPPERTGAAASLSETSAELGGALGIALMGSIVTAVYRDGFAGSQSIAIPAETVETARGTMGAAVSAAGQLRGEPAIELLGMARAAFTEAFGTAAVISAGIAIAVALLATAMLRGIKAPA